MMLMTIERPEGKHYEVLGLVQGSTIQSKNVGHDITQGLKTIVGGELKAYTDMMNQARDIAAERMVQQQLCHTHPKKFCQGQQECWIRHTQTRFP